MVDSKIQATTIDDDLIILSNLDEPKWAHMDGDSRLILPAEFTTKLGMAPNTRVRLDERVNGFWLCRPITQLAKVHIESTSLCNLACRTCIRNIWTDPMYLRFRQNVQAFDFSPCLVCGGCDLSEANEEDCYGNTFPTCGGCLWSQGVIQCP